MTTLTLRAPTGKFRVVGVDTFDGTDWVDGDYDTLERALERARSLGGTLQKAHVYTDAGRHVGEAGSF
jgi:hypothetical protein